MTTQSLIDRQKYRIELSIFSKDQWWIQDFPKVGSQIYYFGQFSRKLHEIEKKLDQEGKYAALVPP